MANETKIESRKPRRWLRWTGFALGGLLLLLVVAYFVGTSQWALQSVILPRVSDALNAKVTVEGASISPFSAVNLRGLKVQTVGSEPLLTAGQVRARYNLRDILGGNLNIHEVLIESPVVTLITFPDGTSNLDPITRQAETTEKEPREPKEPKDSERTKLNLQKFVLNNATVRKIDQRKDGTREMLELTGVNITAEDIGNSKVGQMALAANVRMDQGLAAATNSVLAATVGGKFNFQLDAELQPEVVKGQTKVDVTEARGDFAQASGLGITLNTDLTPTQLNDLSVRFTQNGNALGAVSASGPFNADTTEGKLAVNVSQVDRQVLSLVGGAMGIDFNRTTINSTNTIELTQRGRIISVNGATMVANFSATTEGHTTPPLDLRTAYALTYDQTNRTAQVQQLAINGTQNNTEILRGTLAKPMVLELGQGTNAVGESAFNLVVTNFNLPDWQAFIGTNATVRSGRLNLAMNLVSQQAGKDLSLELTTGLRGLTAIAGSNRIENADLSFDTRGTVKDFSVVNLENYRAELLRGGQRALLASGALQYNTQTQDADVQANVETSLPQVTGIVSVPDVSVREGTVKFAGRITQKNTTPQNTNNPVLDRSVTGQLNVTDLTGVVQSNSFNQFAAVMNLDVLMRGPALEIRQASGTLRQAGQAGGAFDVSGNYHLSNEVGQVTAKLTDLNQHVLRTFLATALGDKQLESININATTTAKLDGPESKAVKAEVRVANLVVNDPTGQVPKTPLAADLIADVALVKDVADLRNVQVALTKTERAPNSLTMAGRIDMSKSNAWSGNVKIASEGLDVTPYYDIFAGDKPQPADTRQPLPKTPAPQATKPPTEPEAITLPFSQFVTDVNIAKFFLREIAISNLVTKATVESTRVNVNPFSLSLNGAPVTLDALVNVGVPGYQYDVNAKLAGVPVEPFVNTFAPERKGQVKGDLFTTAQIKGAGVTDPSLQKNLGGQVALTLTNAEVQITQNERLRKILVPISVALRVPQLAESPLNWVDARATIGQGVVNLAGATVESSAFRAGIAPSTITLAEALTNSALNSLPVNLALRRNIAEAARLVPADTPTNATYVPLPQFVSIAGTVGDPKADINSVAVTRILAGTVGNIIGGDAGKILRGIGNLGGGASTNAPGTNTTSTNAVGNLIQGIGNILNRPRTTDATTTNAPATNAPPARNRGFNLNDLLKQP